MINSYICQNMYQFILHFYFAKRTDGRTEEKKRNTRNTDHFLNKNNNNNNSCLAECLRASVLHKEEIEKKYVSVEFG